MKRDYIDFQDRSTPVGYLITFRCTAPGYMVTSAARSTDSIKRTVLPVTLSDAASTWPWLVETAASEAECPTAPIVESAIRETCAIRRWNLWTVNVPTNHVHVVVTANKKPEAVMSALKANATRAMKEAGVWTSELSPWEFGLKKLNA